MEQNNGAAFFILSAVPDLGVISPSQPAAAGKERALLSRKCQRVSALTYVYCGQKLAGNGTQLYPHAKAADTFFLWVFDFFFFRPSSCKRQLLVFAFFHCHGTLLYGDSQYRSGMVLPRMRLLRDLSPSPCPLQWHCSIWYYDCSQQEIKRVLVWVSTGSLRGAGCGLQDFLVFQHL